MGEGFVCYEWTIDEISGLHSVRITDADEFVARLTEGLSEGCRFLEERELSGPKDKGTISDLLLGGIGEYSVFVLEQLEYDHPPAFIVALKSRSPLGTENYPNADMLVFQPGETASQDMIFVCEVKTTRANHKYSSVRGENVLDLFGGSGSTLIGCEQTGRKAFLMELDPPYCDVIVQRWEAFSGRRAIRVETNPMTVESDTQRGE